MEIQQQDYETYGEDKAEQYYQEDRQMFGPVYTPVKETETEYGTVQEIDTDALPQIPNPLSTIYDMQTAGVLRAVMPRSGSVSYRDLSGMPPVTKRNLQKGMNMAADGWEGSGEKLLLLEYLAENFSCYTSGSEENEEKNTQKNTQKRGLQYEIEYAVGGKLTDRENLQDVLFQLLLLREATNFLHLMRDPARRQEADSMANIISMLLLVPEAAPAISFAIKAAWAYGESILDLRNLMEGKKVPLIKDSASWQLPLMSLIFIRLTGDSYRHTDGNGLDYKGYLRLLLFLKSADSLAGSLMDLVEWNVRLEKDRPDFRLDNCLDALRVELHAAVGRNEYAIERSYGYNM